MKEVGINYYNYQNLSSHTSRFICDLLGMRVVERSCPRPLAGRLFYRLCLRGLSYRDKDAVQVGTMEQSIRRARGHARVWIHLHSLHHRVRAIIQPEDSHMPFQWSTAVFCYSLPIPEQILMLISLFGHILKQVINMLLFASYLHLSYYI